MPEGPSIVIAKEAMKFLEGKKITAVKGNAKIDLSRLKGRKIEKFKTWGKHLLICFDQFTVRVHFMMFGTYLIDEEKSTPLRMGLTFGKAHQLNFYTCSIVFVEGAINDTYKWSEDIMSDEWDAGAAQKKIASEKVPVCDVLLDQHIFSGSGNIIKNEVLYRVKIHPATIASALPPKKIRELAAAAPAYAFDFLKWKKAHTLKKHWEAYAQKHCQRCNLPMHKQSMGKGKRVTYFCTNCQVKY